MLKVSSLKVKPIHSNKTMCSELYISNNAQEVTFTCSELMCQNFHIKSLCVLPQLNEIFKPKDCTYTTHLSQTLPFQMKASKYSPGEAEHWKATVSLTMAFYYPLP